MEQEGTEAAEAATEVFPTGDAPVEVFPEPTLEELAEAARPAGVEPAAWRAEALEALEKLRTKPARRRFPSGLVFLASLALFVLALGGLRWLTIGVVVAILLAHELGHLAAMRLFGYRDTKVFFIPFFGAAASGRKDDASQAQRAIVFLAGPLPGIGLAALCVAAVMRQWVACPPAGVFWALAAVLALNLLNLLPFAPLDGGRFISAILFSRRPWLETSCKVAAAVAFGVAAVLLGDWLVGVIGVFILLSLGFSHRAAVLSQRLREAGLNRPPALEELPDAELLRAYALARQGYPDIKGTMPGRLVGARVTLLQQAFPGALAALASLPAAAALLALYLAACGGGCLSLCYVVTPGPAGAVPGLLAADRAYRGGQIEMAIEQARKVAAERPTNAAAHAALSIYLYCAGDSAGALEHAQDANQLEARDPRPYYVLGALHCDWGESDKAERWLQMMREKAVFRETRELAALLEKQIDTVDRAPE